MSPWKPSILVGVCIISLGLATAYDKCPGVEADCVDSSMPADDPNALEKCEANGTKQYEAKSSGSRDSKKSATRGLCGIKYTRTNSSGSWTQTDEKCGGTQ